MFCSVFLQAIFILLYFGYFLHVLNPASGPIQRQFLLTDIFLNIGHTILFSFLSHSILLKTYRFHKYIVVKLYSDTFFRKVADILLFLLLLLF